MADIVAMGKTLDGLQRLAGFEDDVIVHATDLSRLRRRHGPDLMVSLTQTFRSLAAKNLLSLLAQKQVSTLAIQTNGTIIR